MVFKKKLKNIICIFILSIILLLIILYLYSNTDKIITNSFADTSEPTSSSPDINTSSNIDTDTDTDTDTYNSDFMIALGPCLRIEITANNMNILGIIVTGNLGQNIFNNGRNMDFVNIGKYISTPLPTTQTTSTNPEPSITSNTKVSDLFMQTIGINYLSCDFDKNIKDSNNNIILQCIDSFWSQEESNMKTTTYDNILDSTKMFRTPDNTQTTLFIDIPQVPKEPVNTMPIDNQYPVELNNYIGNIILCLNSNIDNTIMLNSLKINVFGLKNKSIAMWQINDVVDPSTNFLKFILYKPQTPIQTGSSNFININNNEKFLDIPPVSINTSMLRGNNKPLESSLDITTIPNTTNPNTTISNTTISNTTISNTTNPNTTNPNNVELTDHGYKIFTNAHTNIFQRDFNGTSNIYSPYIYY